MFKKTVFGIAAATIVTVSAVAGSASSAQAGSFFWEAPQPEFYVEFGHTGNDYAQRDFDNNVNPCLHLKRKYRNTGNPRWRRRYNRCMRANF